MILVENSKKKDRILIPYGDNSEMISNPIVHKHQHIYFYESVNQRTIQELVIALRSASLYCQNLQVELGLDKAPPVHLHIHSYGGDVNAQAVLYLILIPLVNFDNIDKWN